MEAAACLRFPRGLGDHDGVGAQGGARKREGALNSVFT
jgi:hypothetical protein